MKVLTSFTSAFMMPVVGLLVLVSVLSYARHAAAQDPCPLPPGVTAPPDPAVTAQQVEDGSASLMDFALAVRGLDQVIGQSAASAEKVLYLGCLTRQEGGPYRSGSTYLVQLTIDGRVFAHSKKMALSGRLIKPLIYGAILQAAGINPADLAADPAAALAHFTAAAAGDGGPFDIPDVPGASGYAVVYLSPSFGIPFVLLAGFDLNESHVVEEVIDYNIPSVTAGNVVDRESLKAFVTQAGEWVFELLKSGDIAAWSKSRVAFRDTNGPWKHDSVYLYVLDLISNIILLHGAFPDQFELRPLVATVRDAVTGKLILPQVIEAATSNPEGGFVEYHFDDPTDDTDSVDIPKVGYARQLTGEFIRSDGRVISINFIIGSGFYGRAADVGTGPSTVVEASVLGDAVEGLDVEFSRAIAGRRPDYAWSAVTDAAGLLTLTISSPDGVSGYYRARATNVEGEVVGQWSSIPLNEGHRQTLELTLGGGARIVRVLELAAEEPVAASKPVFEAETVPEASGLSPNSPNPFNSATVITYHLSGPGPVKLVIYNVLGQPVRTLVNETGGAGTYHVSWDARDDDGVVLSTGVYIAHLNYPGGVHTQRLLYLK